MRMHVFINRIRIKEQALWVMGDYEKHNNENLYESIVDVIVNVNDTMNCD